MLLPPPLDGGSVDGARVGQGGSSHPIHRKDIDSYLYASTCIREPGWNDASAS